MEPFFERNENKRILESSINRIEPAETHDNFEKIRNKFIINILKFALRRPDIWDRNCQINIEWIGDDFIQELSNIELGKYKLDNLCSSCFRFMTEFDLSIKSDIGRELFSLRRELLTCIDEFDEQAKSQIEFTMYEMPILMFKRIAHGSEISDLRNFEEITKRASNLKNEWEKDLKSKKDEVDNIRTSLEKYKNAYNFVGLYDGFNDLHSEKIKEKNNILMWMRIMSVIIVSPLVFELIYLYLHITDIEKIKVLLMLSFLPTVSLVGIAIYYFRILLVNYKSAKSQILQLDLRKTLCRFIQHYAEYSKDIKSKDQDSLEKFEKIIFSGIVSDNEKLPSTFDGMEQLSKLIRSIK